MKGAEKIDEQHPNFDTLNAVNASTELNSFCIFIFMDAQHDDDGDGQQ